ncbi:hypothetical protein [Streptomyces scabiei]|uniref:hypothetical protein n=1 Tax=Streptomyces scabiei TaxID=1930 RepID=UPI0039F4C7A6
MARGIATRDLPGGDTVTVIPKDSGNAVQLVDELHGQAPAEGGIAAEDESAVDTTVTVVVAVPFDAAKQLAAAYFIHGVTHRLHTAETSRA